MLFKSVLGDVIITEKDLYFKEARQVLDDWEDGVQEFEFQTSGSTGVPKLFKFTREQIKLSVNRTIKAFNLKPDDLLICALDIHQTGGKMMLFRSLILGSELLVVKPGANPLLDLKRQEKLIQSKAGKLFISLVPYQLKTILDEDLEEARILNSAKAVLLGGSSLREKQEEQFNKVSFPLFLGYGMTETLSHIALRQINQGNKEEYFKVLNNIAIRKNKNGCAEIKTDLIKDKWLLTNDLIELNEINQFKVLGRADHVIISGGIKIHLNKIEKTISENLSDDLRLFAFGLPDEKLGQKLVLFVEANNKEIQKDLNHIVNNKLSKLEQPKNIYFLKRFPETESQKIDKLNTINEAISA